MNMKYFEIKIERSMGREKIIIPAESLAEAKKYPDRKPRTKIVQLVKCKGEAHSNPFIDHCGVCMPRWGWCEVTNEQ
jgi:hypothetical protein